ncbi:uncharacterized protein LOC119357664 [Triticum dicoccoides]|uniref:uncharacterized protein LOC119357664 n=1 Tax=Triticum dicoccoides TaxID=85692 RepID=UPI00188FFB8D|nr:uncharacterized protein LOC119357664 [Triticum dicoccoides]
MSSCLGSVRSLSPGVLSCLLVVVFLSWRRFLRFVLRRLAYVVLVCWRFPLCSLLVLLRHLLHRPLAPPLLPTPSGGSGRPRPHCVYCNNDGHLESQCYTKKKHLRKARSSSSGTSSSTSTASAIALTEQDILRLKRLLAASGSSSTGTAGSVTDASRTEQSPSTQSGPSHAHSGWGWPSPP